MSCDRKQHRWIMVLNCKFVLRVLDPAPQRSVTSCCPRAKNFPSRQPVISIPGNSDLCLEAGQWAHMNIAAFLGKQHRSILILFGSMALALVGVGDYFATGEIVEFSVFFLIPISFFTWFLGRRAGLLACVTSAVIIMGVNLSSPLHEINHRVAYWNTLVWLGFFMLITFVIAHLKVLHLRERELSRVEPHPGCDSLSFLRIRDNRDKSSPALASTNNPCLRGSRLLQRGQRSKWACDRRQGADHGCAKHAEEHWADRYGGAHGRRRVCAH